MAAAAEVAEIISGSENTVALTGAGLSVASGISTFRDDSGHWHDEQASRWAYRAVFDGDPKDWYESYWQFHERRRGIVPSAGHYALRDMVESGTIDMVVSQNVDGLEAMAGVPMDHLIEIHGNDRSLSCANWEEQGCDYRISMEELLASGEQPALPLCPEDGNPLKPDLVLIFDTYMPEDIKQGYDRGAEALEKADTLVVVGSSLPIIPWFEAARNAGLSESRSLVVINPNATNVDGYAQAVIREPAEEALPEIRDLLAA